MSEWTEIKYLPLYFVALGTHRQLGVSPFKDTPKRALLHVSCLMINLLTGIVIIV